MDTLQKPSVGHVLGRQTLGPHAGQHSLDRCVALSALAWLPAADGAAAVRALYCARAAWASRASPISRPSTTSTEPSCRRGRGSSETTTATDRQRPTSRIPARGWH
eukprot:2138251-Prymnesium_polylepis.2